MLRASLVFFALLSLSATNLAQSKVPSWLQQALSLNVPSYDKSVPAVALHDERQVTLQPDGKLIVTDYYAVKILNKDGKRSAILKAFYLSSATKVKEINAWLVKSDGSVTKYDKKDVIDIISDPDDVYNEGRVKVIDASDSAGIGDVFGYTVTTEEVPLFYQDVWMFQDRLPTLFSSYSLTLPKGWKAISLTFNYPSQIEPKVNGTVYTWQLRNLPPIPPEPSSPSIRNLAPKIAVNYMPDDGSQAVNKAFADWIDVSRWATSIFEPQLIVDDAIASKAKELTANAQTEFEKIKAIAKYVQNLQYISIDIGVAYGNGYKPRPSNLVLARGYGDCKDKSNLMRALLKAIKIDAYPVVIYSGDPTLVRKEWASPMVFNHCIIAIKVGDETKAETIIEHPKLGRLLLFDPTDPHTILGDLPDYLQGGYALIIAGSDGDLTKMPVTSLESNLLERNIEVTLLPDGTLKGKIIEKAKGQVSASFRREYKENSPQAYKKIIEGWLTQGTSGVTLENLKIQDNETVFQIEVDFVINGYAQSMLDRLLVFKPLIVGRKGKTPLTATERKTPLEINQVAIDETIIYELPNGFAIEELPEPLNLESHFGKYSIKLEPKENKLFLRKSVRTNWAVFPANEYGKVKDFFSKIANAEESPVILARK
ncbi:MAG: DUF3857 domain-containing protein [Acidobacteria bacterium]|jgi:hypothetical protein|nr:MAG: DUF3857 domain-containing protein [Acidobacteriota bacterium]GIU82558.1 MAG: hypothetical protein KatS3mg006_1622 [Pyrinomonadaceae bacterium]